MLSSKSQPDDKQVGIWALRRYCYVLLRLPGKSNRHVAHIRKWHVCRVRQGFNCLMVTCKNCLTKLVWFGYFVSYSFRDTVCEHVSSTWCAYLVTLLCLRNLTRSLHTAWRYYWRTPYISQGSLASLWCEVPSWWGEVLGAWLSSRLGCLLASAELVRPSWQSTCRMMMMRWMSLTAMLACLWLPHWWGEAFFC